MSMITGSSPGQTEKMKMNNRAQEVIKGVIVFVCAGIFYLIFMTAFTFMFDTNMIVAFSSARFDDYFHEFHIYLPKTGGQRMLSDIFNYNYDAAVKDSYIWILVSPVVLFFTVNYLRRYVRTGSLLFKKYEKVVCVILMVLFIISAIYKTSTSYFYIE